VKGPFGPASCNLYLFACVNCGLTFICFVWRHRLAGQRLWDALLEFAENGFTPDGAVDGYVPKKPKLFLVGDWKSLAMVCGVNNPTANYPCCWCFVSKQLKGLFDLVDAATGEPAHNYEHCCGGDGRPLAEWPIQRSMSHLKSVGLAALGVFGQKQEPLFPFIPFSRVILDELHLFLRLADLLMSLLIYEVRVC
jgi:hypothetical protein